MTTVSIQKIVKSSDSLLSARTVPIVEGSAQITTKGTVHHMFGDQNEAVPKSLDSGFGTTLTHQCLSKSTEWQL